MKGGYEAKIKMLEQQLQQASSSGNAVTASGGGGKGTTKHSTIKPSASTATSKDVSEGKTKSGNAANVVALQGRIK